MKSLPLMLAFVLFTAGCVEFGGLLGQTGGQTKVAPVDVLQVGSISIIPSPPIPAASSFDVVFQVENIGDFQSGDEAKNVVVYAFDWGRCSVDEPQYQGQESDFFVSSGDRIIQLKGIPEQPVTIFPGGSRLIEWHFAAPDNAELGGVSGVCPIRFRASYDFQAVSTADVIVITEDRLRQANRAGESASELIGRAPLQTQSRGPLKISLDLEATQPVRSESTVPFRITLTDKGAGLYREIPAGALKITFPAEFTGVACDQLTGSGSVFTNAKIIPLIRRQTPPVRCDFKAPGDEAVVNLRTFNVRAQMDYTYDLFDEASVSVRPTYAGIGSTSGSGQIESPGGETGGETGGESGQIESPG